MLHSLFVPKLAYLSDKDEISHWENRPFITKWPDQDKPKKGEDLKKTIKKKPKRVRTAFTTEQLKLLEKVFSKNVYIDSNERQRLSEIINVGDKQIKVWFQNRRMKEKKRLSECSDVCSETSGIPSPRSAHTNDNTYNPEVASASHNHDTATIGYMAPSNGFAEMEYQLPNHVNDNTFNNMGYYFGHTDNVGNNFLEYFDYMPMENCYGYPENVSAAEYSENYGVQYNFNGSNNENYVGPSWCEDYNFYNTDNYGFQ